MLRNLWLMALLLLSVSLSQAQDREGLSPDLSQQLDGIEARTISLRGLAPLDSVSLFFPTRDELQQFLIETFESDFGPQIAEAQRLFYVAFDLLPPEFDLRASLLEFYGQQIGGFYDTEAQAMNVILLSGQQPGDSLPLLENIIYSHEFVHVLQDQHFDLDALLAGVDPHTNGDAYLARLALIEGDATFVMNDYTVELVQEDPFGALLQIGSNLTADNLTIPAGTPQILADELLMPYLAGESFVRYLFNSGGWDEVNFAYQNPPQSTEHILHPERYVAGDNPIVLQLRDQSANLPGAWQAVRGGVLGEFYLRAYLDTQLNNAEQIQSAALGWGGDAFQIYQNESGELAWALQLAWDTAEDADEFVNTMAAFIGAQGLSAVAEDLPANVKCFTGESAICLLDEDERILLSTAPTLAVALPLMTP